MIQWVAYYNTQRAVMTIFNTKATLGIFDFLHGEDKTLLRIHGLLRVDDEVDSAAAQGQIELFGSEHAGPYKIHWVGIRMNRPGRLIGAVVRNRLTGAAHFFVLEVTPVHDYRKTLVDNPERLVNWRWHMLDYLRNRVEVAEGPAAALPKPQRLVQHEGRFRAPDAQQMELMDIPLHQGALCFGPPGAGKTLVGVQRAIDYMGNGLKTVSLAPTQRLSDSTRAEIKRQGVSASDTGSEFWSYEGYLSAMALHYPELRLVYDQGDARAYVDVAYFKAWYREGKKRKALTDGELMALWQEFNYVLLQPDWRNPNSPCLSEEAYVALGVGQSNVPQDERASFYGMVFSPFFSRISDDAKHYFPPLVSQRLYNELSRRPLLGEQQFDALLLDEVQKFHPWEWACVLTLLNKPLAAGQYFICGDAHQGAECQSLRVAETLRGYFEFHDVRLPVYHLTVNHRSSEAVGRFVAQLHALELAMLGSMERYTHVQAGINERGVPGRVITSAYHDTWRTRIADDASAYVLIPDERCCAEAEVLWPAHQIVTLSEFAGMSATTVVMFGFSAYFKETLDKIQQAFPTDEALPSGEAAQTYARRSKGLGLALPVLRAAFQSLYTAASRAVDELVIIEPEGRPHRLLQRMQTLQITRPQPAAAAAAAVASEPTAVEKKSTPEECFERAKEDFKRGLETQAKAILLREDLWGAAKVAAVRALITTGCSDEIFTTVQAVLFPRATPVAIVAAAAASAVDAGAKPLKAAVVKPKAVSLAPLVKTHTPLEPTLREWLETLATRGDEAEFNKLLTVKGHSLKELLFVHDMKNGHCLLVNLVTERNNPLIHQAIKNNLVQIKQLYKELKKPDILLQLCWQEVFLKARRKEFRESLKPVMSNASQLRKLLATDSGVAFVTRHWDVLMAEKIITANPMHASSPEGVTAFALMIRAELGVKLLFDKWVDFKKYKLISSNSMHQVAIADGTYQGTTPFFLLAGTPEGRQLISNHWDYFVSQGLISPNSMHQVVTAEVANQGTTAFFWLTCSREGRQLIGHHWDYFVEHGLLSPNSMHQIVTGEGVNQGTTAFFWLSGSPEGLQLMIDHWDYFVAQGFISATSMHQVVTGEGAHKGTTAFFWLACNPEGRQLISNHWDYFVSQGLISPDSMHQVVTAEGAHKGTTPFFWLSGSPEGRQLISNHWDYFVSQGLLSPNSMHQVVTGEEVEQGTTPFFWLAANPEGLQLMIDHWDYFVEHGLLSPISMHQVVTAEGPYQGLTPFYWLISASEGRQLIGNHWDDFVRHGLFPLESTSRDRVIGEEDEFKGKTISEVLASIAQGRSFVAPSEQAAPVLVSVALSMQGHGLFATGAGEPVFQDEMVSAGEEPSASSSLPTQNIRLGGAS